jgi:hypothetical protein
LMLKGTRGRVVTLIGVVFVAVSIWFLGNSFVQGVHEAGGMGNLLRFDVPVFLLASVLMAVHLTLAGYTWSLVTGVAGGNLGLRKGFAIHFLSQVGKYVPGKVWAAMGKFTLSRDSGLSTAQTGQGLVLETVFIVLGCLITTLPLIPLTAGDSGVGVGVGLAVAAGFSAVLVASLHPVVFGRFSRLVNRVMKSDYTIRERSFTDLLRVLPVYVAVFVTLGAAYWLMCIAFGLNMPFFPGVFVYPAAMGIGYLAIFAPGGLGARELTTVWLVHLIVPGCEPGLAELTAVVARLWITLGEAIAFGVSFPLYGVSPSSFRKMLDGSESADGNTLQGDEG